MLVENYQDNITWRLMYPGNDTTDTDRSTVIVNILVGAKQGYLQPYYKLVSIIDVKFKMEYAC